MIELVFLIAGGFGAYALVFLYLTRHFKRSAIPGVGIIYPGKIRDDSESA